MILFNELTYKACLKMIRHIFSILKYLLFLLKLFKEKKTYSPFVKNFQSTILLIILLFFLNEHTVQYFLLRTLEDASILFVTFTSNVTFFHHRTIIKSPVIYFRVYPTSSLPQ